MQNKRGEKSKTMQNKSKIITTSIFRRGVLNKSLSVNEKEKKRVSVRTFYSSELILPPTSLFPIQSGGVVHP